MIFRGRWGRDGGMLVTEQDGQFKSQFDQMSIKPSKPRGHAANIKHLKNNQDVVYKGLLGFYKIQVFYNPGVFFPFTF